MDNARLERMKVKAAARAVEAFNVILTHAEPSSGAQLPHANMALRLRLALNSMGH